MLIHDGYIDEFNILPDKPFVRCKGGGGGSSGKVDFPIHMKTAHKDWLDDTGSDTMTFSIVDLMNTAMAGASPYNGYVPKDPDGALLDPLKTITSYTGPFEHLLDFDGWDTDTAFLSYIADDAVFIANAVNAHSDQLEDELDNKILPRFKAGMVNMNATNGSAFVIGEALLRDSKQKKLAETDANIRLQRIQQGSDIAIRRVGSYIDHRKIIIHMSAEFARLYLAAHFERDENYLDKLRKDAVWDMEMYTYGCQVMACISGTASTVTDPPKTSALGGAISGAAAGAAIGASTGNPAIAGVGAAVGGIAGYLSA